MNDRPVTTDHTTESIPRLTDAMLDRIGQGDVSPTHGQLPQPPMFVQCNAGGQVLLAPLARPLPNTYLAYANEHGAVVLIPVWEASAEDLHRQLPIVAVDQIRGFLANSNVAGGLASHRFQGFRS